MVSAPPTGPQTSRLIRPQAVDPAIGAPRPVAKDRQFIAADARLWLKNYARSLPQQIDDVSRDFGNDVYERMMHEPFVRANVQLLLAAVLEDGPQLRSPIEDEEDPNYAKAAAMRDGLADQLDDLPQGFENVLIALAEATWRGNRVVEMSWRVGPGHLGPTTTIIDELQPKPWRNVAFVVDAYNRAVGILGRVPDADMTVMQGTILNPKDYANLIPREKFIVFSWAPHNNDPRGTSILRPIYSPWWRKQQVVGDYLRFLGQFASPSLFGTTPEDNISLPLTDALGNPITGDGEQTPEEALQEALLEFYRNGSVFTARGGTKLDVIESNGSGQAFLDALNYEDAEIAIGITLQRLANGEAQFGTRAQASVHQDILGLFVRMIRRALIRCVQRDFIRQWVLYNYGAQDLPLAPLLSLGETQSYDLVAVMGGIAELRGAGYIGASQLPHTDKLLGFPQRDLEYDEQHPLPGKGGAPNPQQQPDEQPEPTPPTGAAKQPAQKGGGGG